MAVPAEIQETFLASLLADSDRAPANGAPPVKAASAPDEVILVRNPRARHYRLTLRRDGVAVATIPVRGSEREARRFIEAQREWLARAREQQQRRPRGPVIWTLGTHVLWRGALCEIGKLSLAGKSDDPCWVELGPDRFRVPRFDGDLRPTLEGHFRRCAQVELPARTWELAAVTGVGVTQVTVRNQRSRWGSCSTSGAISLNWRLVQAPENVRDYIIYHELMHLKEMNHSPRFWARVEEVCPGWREAERWLKHQGSLLGL